MTRRVVKPQPDLPAHEWHAMRGSGLSERHYFWTDGFPVNDKFVSECCPYGVPGDRLWVKESYRLERKWDSYSPGDVLADIPPAVWYEADERQGPIESSPWGKLRPSIHMPRKLSRILLEIESVKVERVQDISEEDAKAEGVPQELLDEHPEPQPLGRYRVAFANLWDSIHGPGAWARNDWGWAIKFRRVEA